MTGSYSAGITWSGGGPHYKVYPTYENANGNGFTISPGKNDDTTAWEWKVTFHNALNLTPSSFWFADTTRWSNFVQNLFLSKCVKCHTK